MSEDIMNSGGFVLTRIEVKGFNLYGKKQEISFDEKFSAMVGPTGSGKSSWLDALEFALYKRNARTEGSMKIEDILSIGGYVIVEFEKDENKYSVKRGRQSERINYLHLVENGNRFKGGITVSELELVRILGMDYKAFTSSSIIRQGEIAMFSKLTDAERVDKLQHLFHLVIFQKALKHTKAEKKEKEKIIDGLRGRIEGMQTSIFKEKLIRDNIKKKVVEIKALKVTRKEKIISKKELTNEVDLLQKDQETLGILVSKKEGKENRIKEVNKSISVKSKEVEHLKSYVEKMKIHKPDADDLEEKKNFVEERDNLRVELETAKETMKSRNEIISKQKERYTGLLDKYEGGITIEEYTEFAKELGVVEYKKAVADAKRMKKQLKSKKEECVKGVVSDVLKREMQVESDGGKLESKVEELVSKLNDLEKELGGLTIDDINSDFKVLNSVETETSFNEDKIGGIKNEITDLEEKTDVLHEQLDEIREQIGDKETQLSDFKEKKKQLDALIKEIGDIDVEIGEAKGHMEAMRNEISEIGELKEKIKETEDKITGMEKETNILSILEKDVFHNSGIGMFATESIIDVVAMRSSQILDEMTDGEWTKIQFLSYRDKRRYGFKIFVNGRDVDSFSGGEKTQINAAIRLSIAEKLSELSTVGARMKTLFIDEGDLGSLDDETAREKFIETIFNMEGTFEKVILITHMQDLVDRFPFGKVIRIEKRSGFSTVVT